jgi:hypothetical protein
MLGPRIGLIRLFLVALFCSPIAVSASALAETFDSTIADTRTTIGLSVDTDAAQVWLPTNWVVTPVPEGPFAGSNTFIVFIDRLLHLDAEGNPKGGGAYRMAVVAIPAKNASSGESTLFIARVYTPHEGAGPYKTSAKSTVRRDLALSGSNVAPAGGSDSWAVESEGKGELSFRMVFDPAVPKRVQAEVEPRSPVDPDYYRIYRYEQLVDVVKSVPADIDRVPSFELTTTVPELLPMLDGTEQIIGIAFIPWYGRETFLP